MLMCVNVRTVGFIDSQVWDVGPTNPKRNTCESRNLWFRTSCSACHELLCSRAFLFIILRSAQHPKTPPFFANFPRNVANVRNARAFPLLPAALASVPFGFVLVRVRVDSESAALRIVLDFAKIPGWFSRQFVRP